MSVRAGERIQGDLTVIVRAKENAAYTLRTTHNETNFPKRYRLSIVNRLQDKAFDILSCLIEANEFYPKSKEELEHRRFLQRKAMAECRSMLTLIDIAKETFGIKTTTIKYWTKLLSDIRNLTASWLKKEEKRFNDLL